MHTSFSEVVNTPNRATHNRKTIPGADIYHGYVGSLRKAPEFPFREK